MKQLTCNIVAYSPDPAMLAENFRHWHVEALLGEAATLIDRCLEGFKEYSTLNYYWNQFRAELEAQERQLDFDKQSEAEEKAKRSGADTTAIDNFTEASKEGLRQDQETEPEQAEATLRTRLRRLREEALQRKKELSAPGGAFALDDRRDLALQRLCRDYEETVNRVYVAQRGLKDFYGYERDYSPVPMETEALGVSITNLGNWIRNSLEWLTNCRLKEEAFTRIISVRSLLSRSAWQQLKQAREIFSTKLSVPAIMFKGYDNCLLRGIGAAIVGEAGAVPWSITLSLPDVGLYARGGRSMELDQSSRPCCMLGRVENRRSGGPVEVCGGATWRNASPIGSSTSAGQWSLEIVRPTGVNSETFNQIEDVVLEVYAVGTP